MFSSTLHSRCWLHPLPTHDVSYQAANHLGYQALVDQLCHTISQKDDTMRRPNSIALLPDERYLYKEARGTSAEGTVGMA
jgi:sugar lactone lactonase YvrE